MSKPTRTMSKAELKMRKIVGKVPHPEILPLTDLHRFLPRAEGGELTDANYTVSKPEEHMKSIGTWREREPELAFLKAMLDDRGQLVKMTNAANSRLLAAKRRTDEMFDQTREMLLGYLDDFKKDRSARDGNVRKTTKELAKEDPLLAAPLTVDGVGEITSAFMRVYVDLGGVFPEKNWKGKPHKRAGQEKCPHASSLVAYVGDDKPSHKRYEKNKASGGNKTLRTALYAMANSQVRSRGAYRETYDRVRERLAKSTQITKTRNTRGDLVECAWKDTKPGHQEGAALRAVRKLFLFDYWYVGRSILGLPNGPCYAETHLGDGHRTSYPQERGWEWEPRSGLHIPIAPELEHLRHQK